MSHPVRSEGMKDTTITDAVNTVMLAAERATSALIREAQRAEASGDRQRQKEATTEYSALAGLQGCLKRFKRLHIGTTAKAAVDAVLVERAEERRQSAKRAAQTRRAVAGSRTTGPRLAV
jgi:hypothetical protein